MITAERMRALARPWLPPAPRRGLIEELAPELERRRHEFGVTTPLRVAHLMAQLCHESAGFRRLTENLSYDSPGRIALIWPKLRPRAANFVRQPQALANAAYANRLGNGDELSGDGWTYRGRGLIQITGRDNYRRFSAVTPYDLVEEPDRADEPETAVVIALAYWRMRGCNQAADRDDVAALTRLINGGNAGLVDRCALTARAKEIFIEAQGENT
jgi:putative chitinase